MDFLNKLKQTTNFSYTENGAITHKTTHSDLLDMFAMCGAYRNRTNEDCILAFDKALEENEEYAMKCLFYLRDIRGGQGERRFFRVCINWLANEHPDIVKRNLTLIPEFGRWDDLYSLVGTPVEADMFGFIREVLLNDLSCEHSISLLAKWLKSENTSSQKSRKLANLTRQYLGMTHKEYRQMLSALRAKLNIVETLMSENRWEEIQFDKIPSKAGLIYKNAFAYNDIIKEKYAIFAKDKTTTVNAKILNPVNIALKIFNQGRNVSETDVAMYEKFWNNLKDYYQGRVENGLAVVDTSGSMYGTPIAAAVSMGAYIAERGHGPFANHFITFSNNPHLVEFNGKDIVDKFRRARNTDWGFSTNLSSVFDLMLNTLIKYNSPQEDVPDRLYIFSDMEFNSALYDLHDYNGNLNTLIEDIEKKWNDAGYTIPEIVFWNLDARTQNIPAIGGKFSYVSGFSMSMLESILSGKTGYDLMMEKLNSPRYKDIY